MTGTMRARRQLRETGPAFGCPWVRPHRGWAAGDWQHRTLSFLRWTTRAVEAGRVTAPRPTLGQLNGHVFGSTPKSSAHRFQVMTVVSAGTGSRVQKPIDELPLKIPVPCPGL